MQVHKRQWTCQRCRLTVYSRGAMAVHLKNSVCYTETDGQLQTLLDLYECPMDEQRFVECPLCNITGHLKSVLEHVGRHMEELSLFALPKLEAEEGDEGIASDSYENMAPDPSKLNEAEASQQEELFEKRQALGPSHPDTPASMANLEPYYRDQDEQLSPRDPSGLLFITVSAIKSSSKLYDTIQTFKVHPREVRELLTELDGLNGVLQTLSQTAGIDVDVDISGLKETLRQFSRACEDFEGELLKYSSRSGGDRASFREWASFRYLGSDGIEAFRQLLISYKGTISVAISFANL